MVGGKNQRLERRTALASGHELLPGQRDQPDRDVVGLHLCLGAHPQGNAVIAGTRFQHARVYLHDLVWEADERNLYARMDHFLDICAEHVVRPFSCFFDDCHNPFPKLGQQPLPVPAYHNSGWNTCPSRAEAMAFWENRASETLVNRLKGCVQRTIERFINAERVEFWELYNEPGRGSSSPNPEVAPQDGVQAIGIPLGPNDSPRSNAWSFAQFEMSAKAVA